MEKIRRIVECSVKQVGDRTLEILGSTETMDRCEESIAVKGWLLANYRKNPVFQWVHDYRSPPIGKATKVWKDARGLMFNIEFVPADVYEFSELIFQLYLRGFLRAVSVGFMPLKWEDGPGKDTPWNEVATEPRRIYTRQDLLELSGCPVPANPEALVSATAEGLLTAKQLEAFTAFAEIELKEQAIAVAKGLGQPVDTIPTVLSAEDVIEVIGNDFDGEDFSDTGDGDDIRTGTTTGDPTGTDTGTVSGNIDEVEEADPVTKPEETETHIRLEAKGEAGKHTGHETRTISISKDEGIQALYCIPDKVAYTYIFEKAKGWTMAKAKQWMKDHGKVVSEVVERLVAPLVEVGEVDGDPQEPEVGLWPEAKAVSQEEVRDELDYCNSLVVQYGLNKETREVAFDLVREILRFAGDDIPEDIAVEKVEGEGPGFQPDEKAVITETVRETVKGVLGLK